jgi:hypothetical protein
MKIKVPGKCDGCSADLPIDRHGSKRFCGVCRPIRLPRQPLRNESGAHICEQCKGLMGRRWIYAKFCSACAFDRTKVAQRNTQKRRRELSNAEGAWKLVTAAIRYGFLPSPKTLICVDCGNPAECYDHREYAKPLDVAAVCNPCNLRRGPAIDAMPDARRKAA